MSNPTISALILDDNVFMGHAKQPTEENPFLTFRTFLEDKKEEEIVMKDYDKAKVLFWSAPDVYLIPEQRHSWSLIHNNICKPLKFISLEYDVHTGIQGMVLCHYDCGKVEIDYFAEGTIQLFPTPIRNRPTKEHIKRFLKEGSFDEIKEKYGRTR